MATNAVRQGLLVGNNLTDHKMAYRGTQGTSGLYLFGWTIGSTGVTKESATLNDLEVKRLYLKIIIVQSSCQLLKSNDGASL